MIHTGNKFLCLGKKLLKTELLIFLSSETYLNWNLAFVIRWAKYLFFNSFFKVWSFSFYQLFSRFFLTDFSSFSSSGILNLLFQWFLKWRFDILWGLCYKVCSIRDLIDLSSNVLVINRLSVDRTKWFKY